MRPAVLIAGANLAAFALGAVVMMWLGMATDAFHGLSATPPSPAAASSAAPSPASSAQALSAQTVSPSAPAPSPAAAQASASPAVAAPAAAAGALAAASPVASPVPAPAPPAAMTAPSAAAATAQATPPVPTSAPAAVPPAPATTMSTAAATAASAPAPAPQVLGRYVLQLGAFRQAANAARLAAMLQQHAFAARVVSFAKADGVLSVVEVGGYAGRGEAADAEAALRRQTGIAALIVRAPAS